MAGSKHDEKKPNVIHPGQRRRRKTPSLVEKPGMEIPAAGVIRKLGKALPLSGELEAALGLPKIAYSHGKLSFSSDPAASPDALSESFLEGGKIPEEIPDYGIRVSARGSNSYCTLIDRTRKVIIFESIGNAFVKEGGSWNSFLSSLKKALELAKELEASGKKFDFVLIKEKTQEVL